MEKIIVTPVFLAHGVHTKQDIPHILGLRTWPRRPMVTLMITATMMKKMRKFSLMVKSIRTEPLGSDPRLVEILKDRVNNSLN